MRLDATDLRYITPDEFRILTAVEMGSKNHEVVPTQLIAEISAIRGGNVNKCLGGLAKRNLVARVQNAKYDGYRLTYGGLDYLALRTFSRRQPASVASVGKKMAVGKEGDIYVVKGEEGDSRVLKMHRLGRISFRAIKTKRDYLGKRKAASWMYMSRLAAQKEFAFLKALYMHGFPVPVPIDQARHCVVMQLVDSYPLRAIESVPEPGELYSKLMNIIVDFALAGLIHGDFNEFNILVKRKTYEPVVIDFPQMVSVRHENAEYFFNRDVNCIRRFFRRRFHFEGTTWPLWKDVLAELREQEGQGTTLGDNAAGLDIVEEDEEEEEEEGQGKAARHGQSTSAGEEDATAQAEGSDTRKVRIVEPASHATTAAESTAQEDAEPEQERPKRVRIDLEVEASGFGRGLQTELEAYMLEVQDIPESDPEYEDDEDEEEEDEEAEDEGDAGAAGTADQEAESSTIKPDEPFDEEAFQAQMTARMEALRLHKALGNDDPEESGTGFDPLNPDYSIPSHAGVSSDEEDYDSDSSTDLSDGPPASDFTAYSRATRGRGGGGRGRGGGSVFGGASTAGGSSRTAASGSGTAGSKGKGAGKKNDLRMAVAKRIEKELGGKGGSGPGGSSRTKATAGKAKGHKWKANPNYLVGGTNDGW